MTYPAILLKYLASIELYLYGVWKATLNEKIMRNITTINIPARLPSQIAKGHSPHKSGAGKHLDKRTKRLRTRGAQLRRLFNE